MNRFIFCSLLLSIPQLFLLISNYPTKNSTIFKEVFRDFDINNDNCLSKEELVRLLKRFYFKLY